MAPFASLSCLHQGAEKSTVLERPCIENKKHLERGGLESSPYLGHPKKSCASAGVPAHMPLPVKDCGLPCLLQTVGIPI